MRVTRLEIFGFKSFVERFSLNFDKNFIGVVGPNGCGKSNIVDSLRWVLGETHAKQLRGSTLHDLIFNGSDSRKPLGMAEVSITITPDAGWAKNLSEENQAVEKELQEALAREAQECEESESEDEDDSEDEAEKEEGSEEKTEAIDEQLINVIPSTLFDIPGLFEAAEIQLTRRLYRSGESEYFINRVPCRLRDMTDIYRLIGLGSRGLSIVQQGQIGELISKKPQERRELLEEAAGISGFRARMENATRKLDRTQDNMARLADIIIEVEKQTRILKRQANRARARNELKEKLSEADQGLFRTRCAKVMLKQRTITAEQAQTSERLLAEQDKLMLASSRQDEARAQVEILDTELVELRRKRDEVYQALTRVQEEAESRRVALARKEGDIEAGEKAGQRLSLRLEEISAEIDQRTERLEERKKELEAAKEERVRVEESLKEIQEEAAAKEAAEQGGPSLETETNSERAEEIQVISSKLEVFDEVKARAEELGKVVSERRSSLDRKRSELADARVELAASEREISSLEKQLEALAEHAANAAGSREGFESWGRALAAGVRIPEHLQQAVSAVLGEKGGFLVTERADELSEEYERARAESGNSKSQKGGRLGVINQHWSGSDTTREVSNEEREVAPSARLLFEELDIDSDMQGAVRGLLGSMVVVDSLAEGIALNRKNSELGREGRHVVTVRGEVAAPWGWYTTEGKGVGYSFTRRIEELRSIAETQRVSISEIEQALAELEAGLNESIEELRLAAERRDELGALQQRLAELMRLEKREEEKRQALLRAEEKRRHEEALARERQAQGLVRNAATAVVQAEKAVEFELRRIETLGQDREACEQEQRNLAETVEQLRNEEQSLRAELESFLARGEGPEGEARRASFEEIENAIREVEKRRSESSIEVGEAAQTVSEIRSVASGLQERKNRAELGLEKCGLEISMLVEDIRRFYGEQCEAPSEDSLDEIVQEAGGELDTAIEMFAEEAGKLRAKLEREGEVDPTSIERYDEESERLERMKTQYADLEEAGKTLSRTIRQLKEISRARFLYTFNDVSKRFAELVPRLFGGGAGHLELINPEDPLSSGVEIFVRPPGKRVASMELFSGGEKALVAASVLLSMFLHRPSPICVLDEVDAPLDDVNLDRFVGLIREIAHGTQFLIITHNKATMSAVDRLIGITMEESGVSKALSVSFEEAEREVERWAVNQ